MEPWEKIINLCRQAGITPTRLETELGLGRGWIKKWSDGRNPTIGSILRVANYLNVSVDYLVGLSDEPTLVQDKDIISLQRAKNSISPEKWDDMMQILKIGFKDAFKE